MVCLGRWASCPALDPVGPGSHSCSRIAANTKDGTLLKDLKAGANLGLSRLGSCLGR